MEGLRGAFAGQAVSCSRLSARPTKLTVQTSCVATPVKPPSTKLAKRSKVEIVKEKSDFLRHPLMEELVNENSYINEDAVQLMKFHGSYQQDHREKRAFGQGKFYQFMMRTRQPGGTVPNQLYLTMDDLSEQVCSTVYCSYGWKPTLITVACNNRS
jgi:sulfite reductase (ferredoxin)